ncbi:hypothetical protein F441_14199, partial [Phytophthora nicotianae CJ01A1]
NISPQPADNFLTTRHNEAGIVEPLIKPGESGTRGSSNTEPATVLTLSGSHGPTEFTS